MRRNLINIIKGKSLLLISAILMLNICFATINTFGSEPEEKTKEADEVAVSLTEEAAAEEKKDGECTEGDCEKGRGTKVYPDGTKYKGEFKSGKRSGQGRIKSPSPPMPLTEKPMDGNVSSDFELF